LVREEGPRRGRWHGRRDGDRATACGSGRVDALPGRRDQDLDGGLVAVDEGVESLVDQVVERDAAGDEGGEVDLAALDELDHGRVVVDVPDRSAQIDLLHHEL